MSLHEKIRLARMCKNYTQSFMAYELGIDVTNYSRLERGETGIPVDRLHKIAKLLNVSISFLLDDSINKESDSQLLREILKELKQIKTIIEK